MEMMTEESVAKRADGASRGEASVKLEFLTTKEKFHEFLDAEWQCPNKEKDSDNGTAREPCVEEPESKKIKLDTEEKKKKDKHVQRHCKSWRQMRLPKYDQRMCQSVMQDNKECSYGDKCKYGHDVADYMATKPADVGENCYLYDTFGKCAYSFTCRFAKAHTTADFKTVVNADLVKAYENRILVKNCLDKDLQIRLQKHLVAFDKSTEYLKTISNNRDQGKQGNATVSADPSGEEHCVSAEAETQLTGEEHHVSTEAETHVPGEEHRVSTEAETHASPETQTLVKTVGPLTDADVIKLRPCEKKQVDFQDKLYLAPLTTVGNLPFRRICKRFGADITCGEMAMCTNLLRGQKSEWALLKRHESEDLFGVQVEGCFPDTMTRCAELINNNTDVDFVDINAGCPIDLVYQKGGGCSLMTRSKKFKQIVNGMNYVLDVPLTVKMRTGVYADCNQAHKLIPEMKTWGLSLITLHGRSREQRYTKLADWDYISTCSKLASPIPLFGNGDILSYEDAMKARETGVSGIMIARGALYKPWIFTEIKERRHWDISSSERLDILRDFTNFGLEHWGSDTYGLGTTRKFLLQWLSFTCRYIPVGLLERVPQKINERPPYYLGRNYLEVLMASQNVEDWIKISEMLLGPVPKTFKFQPKHKANSYE
ncbi:tRNA-dihydrouridine(47) synthase [NAD(P)(+)]-like isoform X2 [Thalassophryne amazonica]|uniref:tRNA-dihydrouridine(47) synthase [NAD(P)(+)]-like isoform X2 n=1 Tax=Thalassophryne amazonica TaxID=390379 RepID=UPI001471C2F3|nr:tRNA-dihydrouridine(47) synthase [NAD(P)(+)]-like isoform X2 [Thalassophryne amazonica]